jgi:hypothetical protein
MSEKATAAKRRTPVRSGRKETPDCLRALGPFDFPKIIEVEGKTYQLHTRFKHDFFAATAMYEGANSRVVLKIGRRATFFGISVDWIGRWLSKREASALMRFSDVSGVPKLIGMIDDDAVVREYIEGHPLAKGERVHDDFFEQLRQLLRTIHDRETAYVDLEKCENVLVGDDGAPYLIDFQIAWWTPAGWMGKTQLLRWIQNRLQAADDYHVLKLQRRTRPDQLTDAQLTASQRRPWYIRLHRRLTQPLQQIRRGILDRVDPRRAAGERGKIASPPADTSAK